jgi:hypothetical protein
LSLFSLAWALLVSKRFLSPPLVTQSLLELVPSGIWLNTMVPSFQPTIPDGVSLEIPECMKGVKLTALNSIAAHSKKWYLGDVPWDQITHLNYAFFYVSSEGKVETGDSEVDMYGEPGRSMHQ